MRGLRFHDLRHTFGTQVIGNADVSILALKEWMGHADVTTTMQYLHYAPRDRDAELVAEAFALAAVRECAPVTLRARPAQDAACREA